MKTNSVSIRVLRQFLNGNPETGELFWKERPAQFFKTLTSCKNWNTRFAGKRALAAISGGYFVGAILDHPYRAHRVIWALHYGKWPLGQLDHINGKTKDNRIVNLREVTQAQNNKNMKRTAANTSGVCGVSWHKARKKWRAHIGVNWERVPLGFFDLKSEAIQARKAAEIKYGFHPNHGRQS